jgi:hypothetical protein
VRQLQRFNEQYATLEYRLLPVLLPHVLDQLPQFLLSLLLYVS